MYKDMDKILKGYRDKIYAIQKIDSEIQESKEQIKKIEKNIRECNLQLEYWNNGPGFVERVQTSPKGSSFVEEQIEKGISRLVKEKSETTVFIQLREADKRVIQKETQKIGNILNALDPVDKEILTLIYIDKMHYIKIMRELNIAENTVYKRKYKALNKFEKLYNIER